MKTRSLKTSIVAALAILGLAFAVVPTTAEAGHSSSSRLSHRCGSCGGGIYQRLAVVGYSHCGDPIYRWVSVSHRCSGHRSHSSHGSSHGRSYYSSRVQPHDVISGIVSGILNSHSRHRSSHFGRSCR